MDSIMSIGYLRREDSIKINPRDETIRCLPNL